MTIASVLYLVGHVYVEIEAIFALEDLLGIVVTAGLRAHIAEPHSVPHVLPRVGRFGGLEKKNTTLSIGCGGKPFIVTDLHRGLFSSPR